MVATDVGIIAYFLFLHRVHESCGLSLRRLGGGSGRGEGFSGFSAAPGLDEMWLILLRAGPLEVSK